MAELNSVSIFNLSPLTFHLFSWPLSGSNQGPADYESAALTNWAKGPLLSLPEKEMQK